MIREASLTILGSGTSAGVPIIGCDCAVCRSDDPRDQRTRCSAAIRFVDATDQERIIFIDASPDLRAQVLRHGFDRLDAIVFTHNHVDHTFGLDDVRRFNAVMHAPIDIYADAHTMETLYRVYRHVFDKQKNVNDSFVATLIPHLIEPMKPFALFGLRFMPVPLLHGKLPVLGFRVDVLAEDGRSIARVQPAPFPLAYCTDVSNIPPETWPVLRDLKTLILDMLRYRSHPTHMTVNEATEAATQINAERTWFTHMTHDILHADLDPRLPERMALAYDGLVVDAGSFGGLEGTVDDSGFSDADPT